MQPRDLVAIFFSSHTLCTWKQHSCLSCFLLLPKWSPSNTEASLKDMPTDDTAQGLFVNNHHPTPTDTHHPSVLKRLAYTCFSVLNLPCLCGHKSTCTIRPAPSPLSSLLSTLRYNLSLYQSQLHPPLAKTKGGWQELTAPSSPVPAPHHYAPPRPISVPSHKSPILQAL